MGLNFLVAMAVVLVVVGIVAGFVLGAKYGASIAGFGALVALGAAGRRR